MFARHPWVSLGAMVVAGLILLVILPRLLRGPEARSPLPPEPLRVAPTASGRTAGAMDSPTHAGGTRLPAESGGPAETLRSLPAKAGGQPETASPSPTPAAVPPAPGIAATDDQIRSDIQPFKDTKIPVEERIRQIQTLARKGDETSVRTLRALGDEYTYLNRYAVEALGQLRNLSTSQKLELADYLAKKTADGDALIVCAALRSLAAIQGEAAVAEIERAIRNNRERPDGHDEMVRTAAVDMLGLIGSDKALPILAEELNRYQDKGWTLEYGSRLVGALRQINRAEGRAAAATYADRLAAKLPTDPMARRYFEDKIREARSVAENR